MGLLDRFRLRRDNAPPAVKTITSSAPYVSQSVTATEIANRYRRTNTEASAKVHRFIGLVAILADKVASDCAQQKIRLFRRQSFADNRRTRAMSRPVKSVRQMDSLRNPGVVGHKAAGYADLADNVVEVMSHPVLDLLQKPAPQLRCTGQSFQHFMFLCWEITGSRYTMVQSDTKGRPEFLYPMAPHQTVPNYSKDELIDGYWFAKPPNDPVFLDTEDVLWHRRKLSLVDPALRGWCPLEAVLMESDLYAGKVAADLAGLENRSRPDFAVSLTGADGTPISDAQAKIAKEQLENMHRGPRNAGKFALLTGEMTIQPLAFTPAEMEDLAGREHIAATLMQAFGVPESKMLMNDANLASSSTGHKQYQEETLLPRLVADAEFWTEDLLPRFDAEPGEMWLAYDTPVKVDETAEANRLVSLVQGGIFTPDEARAELGYESIEGGDVLRDNAPEPFGGGFDVPPAFRSAAKGYRDEVNPQNSVECGCSTGNKAAISTKDDDDIASSIGAENIPAVREMEREVREWILQAREGIRQAGDRIAYDINEDDLRRRIRPLIEQLFEDGAAQGFEVAASAGASTDDVPQVTRRDAVEAIDNYITEFVTVTTETQREGVMGAVQTGIDKGEPLRDVIQRIKDEAPELADYQAERIARSEASEANARGRDEAWKRLGIGKRFLLSANPCPQCVGFDRAFGGDRVIEAGEAFARVGQTFTGGDGKTYKVGFRDVKGGTVHPSCLCTSTPVVPQGDGDE